MVSDERPVGHPGLLGAVEPASDATSNPGQKLLRALQNTTTDRHQRYQHTVAAQQSKAKQNIPAPRRPGRNDLCTAPVEEVHRLEADVVKAEVKLIHVQAYTFQDFHCCD